MNDVHNQVPEPEFESTQDSASEPKISRLAQAFRDVPMAYHAFTDFLIEENDYGVFKTKAFWVYLGTLVWKVFLVFVFIAVGVLEVLIGYLEAYAVYLQEVFFGPLGMYSNWCHLYEGMEYPILDFYQAIEEEIKTHQLPYRYSTRLVKLWEGNIFSARRLYLKIKYQSFIMYVCSAPFGTGHFFSYWQGEQKSFLYTLLMRVIGMIPIWGGNIVKQFEKVTFYRADTNAMTRTCLHDSVMDVIQEITKEQGLRSLTAEEMKPQTKDFFRR